jgi:hypothetical protein
MELQKEMRAKYSGPLIRPANKAPEPRLTPVPPPLKPVLLSEPTVNRQEEIAPKSDKKTEMILIWCGIGLLLINLVGTWVSFSAANAAKDRANEANRLTRQLLRGTSAAHIVTKVVSQDIRPDNRQIRISFRNDGKVNALNVQGDATVCLQSFPAGEMINCKTIPVSKSQLGFEGDEIALAIDGIVGDGDITLLESNRATIQYSSKLRFNDGFDDWIDESTCQLYVVRHFLYSDRVQERSWANCDVGKTFLATEAKRRAQE